MIDASSVYVMLGCVRTEWMQDSARIYDKSEIKIFTVCMRFQNQDVEKSL